MVGVDYGLLDGYVNSWRLMLPHLRLFLQSMVDLELLLQPAMD
jgi:hypothetical protein